MHFSNNHINNFQYYKTNYRIDSTEDYENNFRRLFLIPQNYKLTQEIKNYLPIGAKVLDFGCGSGHFIDEIRRHNFLCYGVEINEFAKKYAESIGIQVKPELKDFDIIFDAITFWHSLEHLPNPKETLEQVYQFLNNDGYIFIRVPNFTGFWSKILKDRWIWFQPQNHIFHFSVDSLQKLLEATNFYILKIKKQKPNNFQSFLFFLFSIFLYRKKLTFRLIFRKIIAHLIELITGSELFVVAKKR
ncbi:MAG: class I SAM-dependent methyltransferase [Candidatus Kapaibacteriales bacterium]